ncbi:EAL and modified HD-GYP domain-containing signal transduction protein [Carboxydothermus ferrireducens DSM 11255]|uniref:EAL and modified HD-GYP domain-containing signal transduction protein n=2 Tax=Carboxydothermus TaxID=129957 RepID=A0ABX2R779_9THEO|nr:EAL and modified HD-GYP domain-containing signal transduction protein [Carboxydothermus ferrireducens DSM 11255]
MVISDLGKGKSDELLTTSLIRAKFGELLAEKAGLGSRKDEAFLMGMFSLIDVLLQRPLGEILNQLPLAQDLMDALLTGAGQMGDIFQLILAYEKGDWEKMTSITQKLKMNVTAVPDCYLKALAWTNKLRKGMK